MNIHRSRQAGFTLIELLVVIAIIGILSAVILASLSTARSKGLDAAVESNLSTIQTEAEIYAGGPGNNTYGTTAGDCTHGMFSADTTIANAITSATGSASGKLVICGSVSTAYAVEAALTAQTGYWCVDSTGFSGLRVTKMSAGTTACPSS